MKIGIGGIKFSEELVHISHRTVVPADSSFADLIRRLAEKRINVPFVCSSVYDDAALCTFCIATTDFPSLERLLAAPSTLGEPADALSSALLSNPEHLKITQRVGTLTLFPHRRSLALFGRIVELFGQSGIIIHSLCTSISALAINVDYHALDLVAEVLGKIVELPENHAPFRPEFCVRQIST